VPVSAVDVVRVAFDHAATQLFKPFRLGQWTRLAFVGILAGEATLGGFNYRYPSSGRSGTPQFFLQQIPRVPYGILGVFAFVLLVAAALILGLIFAYISSRMRFVLFDSVVAKECHIRRFWSARGDQALSYFLFNILFSLVMLTGIATILVPAAVIAASLGWFRSPREHLAGLILGGLAVLVIFLALVFLAVVAAVLTKDFVVPQMALENIGVVDGWSRLIHMLRDAPWAYAGYLGLKILLRIGSVAVMVIAALVVILVWLIPFGSVGLAGFLLARVIGLGWNVLTVIVTVVFGLVAVCALIYALALATVPIIVFFPAYSIHFFADRYEPLRGALAQFPAGA
jgi:hypothetical protein